MATGHQRRFQRRRRSVVPAEESRPAQDTPPAIQALAAVAVFAAAILINLQTLHYGFLSWDDPTYVIDNPWIRGLSRENLVTVFTKPYYANYLPLHLVSYMVDYNFWGLNPFGYHLQSVLLNGVNAILALLVTRRLFGNFLLAFLAALLFAVHPSHVEAVAWVSIRKDLLSTAFLLLSVLFYDRATGSRSLGRGAYAASVGFFTLGLLSKVSIVALPLFLLLLDWFPRGGRRRIPWKAAIANKIPYALIGLVLVRINALAQVKTKAAYAHDPLQYLMVKGHAVWKYLVLLTGLPEGRPIYDTPQFALGPFVVALNLAGILALPAVIWIAHRRQWRILGLTTGWMLALLIPALAFPLMTYMADRYLYAPSIGFCWLLAAGIVAVSRRAGSARTRAGVVALLTALPLTLFAYRTIEYNRVWAGSEPLWTYGIPRSKGYRVRNYLAQTLMNQKRWAEAERLYKEASAVENSASHQGLAVIYYETHRYADAEAEIEKTLEIAARQGVTDDNLADLEYMRGAIYWVQSEPQKAIGAWEAALRAKPNHERAAQWLRMARGEPAAPAK